MVKIAQESHVFILLTTGLFIGRFQPFHKGHLATVKFALGRVDQLVIVVGSAQKSHEPRNPFTAGERIMMIKEALDADVEIDVRQILIIPVPDVDIHSIWTRYIDILVPKYDIVFANDPFTILLFKERGIKTIEAPLIKREEISATEIRKKIVLNNSDWQQLVPSPVARLIQEINGDNRIRAIAENQLFTHGK
jgi:nicotinamide-nucleotide adenylyltransferase